MRARIAIIGGVALHVAGALVGWLALPLPFGNAGTTARPDEIFEAPSLVWVFAVLPLLAALPMAAPLLQRILACSACS